MMLVDTDLEIVEGVLPYIILWCLSQKQYHMSILLSHNLMQVEGSNLLAVIILDVSKISDGGS